MRLTMHKQLVLGLLLAMATVSAWSAPSASAMAGAVEGARHLERKPEDHLLRALHALKVNGVDAALNEVDDLLSHHPNFRLARLVKGDLLLAKAGRFADIGASSDAQGLSSDGSLQGLVHEAMQRIRARQAPGIGDRLPVELLNLGEATQHAVLVDKSENRLYLFKRDHEGVPLRVADYYISTGRAQGDKQIRGDLKTPEGVYFIRKFIPDRKLASKYGRGAYTLNYPNALDRKQGKTGYGIWLHGTDEDTYSRPPLASEGCVVLPNPDLVAVGTHLQPGLTPVVIARALTWVSPGQWQSIRAELMGAIEDWRQDWESLDTHRYLAHYDADFWADGHNLRSWSDRKQRIFSRKEFQKVAIENLNLLRYPDGAGSGDELYVARFAQSYRSNNYDSDGYKQLFLVRDQGRIRIRFEGSD
ncbi:MAG: L,D-transpeptidase family protein [Gammaproteobacteria bacterium]